MILTDVTETLRAWADDSEKAGYSFAFSVELVPAGLWVKVLARGRQCKQFVDWQALEYSQDPQALLKARFAQCRNALDV